ncbi:GDCCVxC domain-containing (seleno)protein [Roseibium sp.]|uniref:GDCCVxC domain-containing (seleno)protein n=1 Tax=Roseibium sp. TaxID=1936156 RepID=UPI00260C77F6|nr:GDCCVxC domain-containing (seleno)protein [Roseibium sp.]
MNQKSLTLNSRLTCPECGHIELETMPTNACQWFYQCVSCQTLLKPRQGDCCVYCSYGTVPCPPKQTGTGCCEQMSQSD